MTKRKEVGIVPSIVGDHLVKAFRFVPTLDSYVCSLLCADEKQAQVVDIPGLSYGAEAIAVMEKSAHRDETLSDSRQKMEQQGQGTR